MTEGEECGVIFAGLRPRETRSFCFGKRTQNHGYPGGALREPFPQVPPTEYLEISSPNQLVYRLLKGDQKVLVNVVRPPMGDIIPVVLQFP